MNKLSSFIKNKSIALSKRTGFEKILRSYADAYETKKNERNGDTQYPALIGWSIVIITDGKNRRSLDICISSAEEELDGTPYEIIVVGPDSLDLDKDEKHSDNLIHIPYKEKTFWGISGWITKKKNIGIKNSRYDKVVVCHDYVSFMTGWRKGYEKFGDFIVATNVIESQDGKRHMDWITWDYPNIGQIMLPYDKEYTEYQYLNGTYFVGKRDFLLSNLLDEKLRWGEGEDVEWSKRIRPMVRFRMNTESKVRYTKPNKALSDVWYKNTEEFFSIIKE